MKTRLIASLGFALCVAFSPLAQAAESKVDRTVLPPNDPAFHGKINVARPENNYIKQTNEEY